MTNWILKKLDFLVDCIASGFGAGLAILTVLALANWLTSGAVAAILQVSELNIAHVMLAAFVGAFMGR